VLFVQAVGAEDNASKVSLGRRAGVRNPATFANVSPRFRWRFVINFFLSDLPLVVVVWQGFLHGLKKRDAVVDGDHGVALDEVGPGLFDALFASLTMILVSEVLLSGVSCENGLSLAGNALVPRQMPDGECN
jgi:hypothetical protein